MADATHLTLCPKVHAQHFALSSPIVSDPNPTLTHTVLPDGREGKVLIVDDTKSWPDPSQPESASLLEWAPRAASLNIVTKLLHRIARERHLLPILTGICVAILGEMYTTTSTSGSSQIRKCLQYRTSPIADFGIAKGSVLVPESDRLMYKKLSDGSYVQGQGPGSHYWLYFTTIRGEEIILELGTYTFNMCIMVGIDSYDILPQIREQLGNTVPGYYVNRDTKEWTLSAYGTQTRLGLTQQKPPQCSSPSR